MTTNMENGNPPTKTVELICTRCHHYERTKDKETTAELLDFIYSSENQTTMWCESCEKEYILFKSEFLRLNPKWDILGEW